MNGLVWSFVLGSFVLFSQLCEANANAKLSAFLRRKLRNNNTIVNSSYKRRWYHNPSVERNGNIVSRYPFIQRRTIRVQSSASYKTGSANRPRVNNSGRKEQKIIKKTQGWLDEPVVNESLQNRRTCTCNLNSKTNKATVSKITKKNRDNIFKNIERNRTNGSRKTKPNRATISKNTGVKQKIPIKIPKKVSVFSKAEKAEVVDHHNNARRNVLPKSSNMRKVVWDDVLADVAQTYAIRCFGVHNDARHSQQSKYSLLGENIYHTWNWEYSAGQKNTLPLNLSQAMDLWESEKKYFNYFNPTQCPVSKCGHYTQMVRDVSYAVGCGKHFCRSVVFNGKPLHNVHILVCNYGEGYNNKAVPYDKGTPCSHCTDGFTKCVNGLCVR